jgi:hypothetical protein
MKLILWSVDESTGSAASCQDQDASVERAWIDTVACCVDESKKIRPRLAERTDHSGGGGLVDRIEQSLGLGDQTLCLTLVDFLTIECGVLEHRYHLPGDLVALVGKVNDFGFERGVSRVISLSDIVVAADDRVEPLEGRSLRVTGSVCAGLPLMWKLEASSECTLKGVVLANSVA